MRPAPRAVNRRVAPYRRAGESLKGPRPRLADEIRAGLDIWAICLERQHSSILNSTALADGSGLI